MLLPFHFPAHRRGAHAGLLLTLPGWAEGPWKGTAEDRVPASTLLLGAHLGWCPHCTLLSPDPAHCSCACAPGPGTRDTVWPKLGFALTCSKPPFCPVLWDEPRGGGGTVCFFMFCLVSPRKDSENLHRDRQSPQWPIPFREKGSLGRCTGLGNKGSGEPPGTDRVPSAPTAPGHLGATPMPPLSQDALSCRDAGRARHLSSPTGLDLLCWVRCVPGFPGELTAHCEVLLGAISRVPPQVHPGLTAYPVPASVPNHHTVDTWRKICLAFQSAHWAHTKDTHPAYKLGLLCLNLIESLGVLLGQAQVDFAVFLSILSLSSSRWHWRGYIAAWSNSKWEWWRWWKNSLGSIPMHT